MVKPFRTEPASSSTKKSSGFCVLYGDIATVQALFKVPDAVIIQRYCDNCLPKADYVF